MARSLSWVDISAVALGLYLLKRLITRRRFPAPLPPGPRGLPLIGNAADMPTEEQWLKFDELGKRYGNLIYLDVFGQPILILNAATDAFALLSHNRSKTSDRPTIVFAGEIVGWNQTLVLMKAGPRLKAMRKMASQLTGSKGDSNPYIALQELESRRLLRRIYDNPEDWLDAIRRTAGAIILMIAYGYQIKEYDDPLVTSVDKATDEFAKSTQPGAFLVDIIPSLRYIPAWFPGALFQRLAKTWRTSLWQMADLPHEMVKNRMARGEDFPPNFTATYLEQGLSPESEDILKWTAASLYGGGADTTVSANNVFYLAMTLYPDIQNKAQDEIDFVIGNDRLPLLSDKARLPYVSALVKEVLRYMPVAPTGVPHRLTEDEIYAGYFIPAGTLIIPNVWKMLHDPTVYANPFEFKPERFLGAAPEMDPAKACFGFGSRICPGKDLAESSVWLACAMSLSVFNITPYIDHWTGKPIMPEPVQLSGTISHPKPFKCTIRPRSPKAEALITAIKYADGS